MSQMNAQSRVTTDVGSSTIAEQTLIVHRVGH